MIEIDIRDLVPRFLMADRTGRALAMAIERAFRIADGAVTAGVDITLRVDSMPEWRLDEMARELNVPWYVPGSGIETKRGAIRSALAVYRRLGTPWAVVTVAEMYFGSSTVEEWWEYGGEPYHYRVKTANLDAVTANMAVFRELIRRTENLRSVFDGVYADPSLPSHGAWAGFVTQTMIKRTVPMKGVGA